MKRIFKKDPTISVVIATYNASSTIRLCLESLRKQNYPQEKIEIIIVDGSSKDETIKIAKMFTHKIFIVEEDKQNAEYNKAVGVSKANGELLLLLDHDNILPHQNWLKNMLQPFNKYPEVIAVETLRYHYDKSYSLLDRYFALFGAGDPLAYYFGKADRLSFLYDEYNLFGKAKDFGDYYLVKFNKDEIPTLGANGFLIKKEILVNNAQVSPGKFFHIDVNVDLIRKGFNTYAFIKDSIIHLTSYKSTLQFLYRRKLFMEQFYLKELEKEFLGRRYSVYTPKDKFKLIKFILYSATWVKPTFDSFRGWIKIRDIAWFLHPFLCFSLLCIYGYTIIKWWLRRLIWVLFGKGEQF